ncbi:MAG: response regulator transcription factor [Alicyclobacillus sp.]|nr:response regulator transcription factor [Alicyclobacillus sp.]
MTAQLQPQHKIHIVEDDATVAGLLHGELTRYGFGVTLATRLRDIAAEVEEVQPDLILLDINLPYYDGFYWCRQIRRSLKVPIIFISARDSEMDKVYALENGGDDYITKPFHPDVLLAKIRALLRRAYGEYAQALRIDPLHAGDSIAVGTLRLHLDKAVVAYGEREEPLTKTELQLLFQLLKADGQIVSRQALLEALWDDVHFVDDNTLTVNVTRLRRKLSGLGLDGAVLTVRGLGYRLDVDAVSSARPPAPHVNPPSRRAGGEGASQGGEAPSANPPAANAPSRRAGGGTARADGGAGTP